VVSKATVAPSSRAVEAASPSWIVRYFMPNSAGRITVRLWESPSRNCRWVGFSLSLQEVLDYPTFKREASRATEAPFRYDPAEHDPTGAAWLALVQAATRYPEPRLTDRWGEHCPGSTRRQREGAMKPS